MSVDANPKNHIMIKKPSSKDSKIQKESNLSKEILTRDEDRRKNYRINSGRRQIDLITYYWKKDFKSPTGLFLLISTS